MVDTALDTGHAASAPLVLIADDEPDILALVRFGLERSGYRVLSAVDGGEALALGLEHRPDVVVLDVAMPQLSGLEVTRRLRAEQPAIRVVLLTAGARDADVADGVDAGANVYMTKPFSPQALVARVAGLLADD